MAYQGKNQDPEDVARDMIDTMLENAGWVIQDKDKINFGAGEGVAIREYQTDVGPADYALFLGGARPVPVGIVEAKRPEEGHKMVMHERQVEGYAESKLKYLDNKPLPFIYISNGEITLFSDARDPKPRFREVFSFHRPETLANWINERESLRARLQKIPPLDHTRLRDCQINAIENLDKSFKDNRPRALIQMATGAGKTYTAITSVYRLLKFAGARRALFLVDTRNLGEQAEQEFMSYIPPDDNRKFNELYNVYRLTSNYVPDDAQVIISTIQRLYSILKGEELDPDAETVNPNELALPKEPVPVEYNSDIPIEFFDFIIIDECHRSIYNVWQQVLDYFDAFLIGLTATPDKRTFGFFHENVVSEYSHEDAVADGVNVGYDVYVIETEITKNGAKLAAKEYVEKRERLTRKKRWEQLDEDLEYSPKELDRDVVNPSQIRNVIKAFKEKLPEIFPGRSEVPKTLIFAKNDSHADDIVRIVREEFGEGNDFCKKVTYKSEEDPKSILSQFRNEYNPRIAVTVDMIATGTDVKPLECLIFMRDVKSKNYFEQMKGRGTRTLDYDDLKKVTPSAFSPKTHFVIIDAVGVTKHLKTDSRPLERKRSVPMKDLILSVMMGASRNEDTMLSLAGRLARLDKQMSQKEKEEFEEKAGESINQVVHDLLDAFNPDAVEERAKKEFNNPEPSEEEMKTVQKEMVDEAASVFTGELSGYIENVRKVHEQIIDNINIDTITFAGWDETQKEKAGDVVKDFREFLEAHRDELDALRIFYDVPYRRRELTFRMLNEVLNVLESERSDLSPSRVWQAYERVENVRYRSPKNKLVALVSLIRRALEIDSELTPFDRTVDKNFKDWVFEKNAGNVQFTEEQMWWLRNIKEHIAASMHLDREDLDLEPFDARGGIGGMYRAFGDEMDKIIDELNEVLVS